MFFFLLPDLRIIYIFVWKPRKVEWWLHPVVTQYRESFVVLAGAFLYNLILIQVKTTFLAGRWGSALPASKIIKKKSMLCAAKLA